MQARDRLIIAVDASSRDEVIRIADEIGDAAGLFKIGLQAFVANGPELVRELVARGLGIFVDLKIHDIPNTAGNAVAEAVALGAAMVTVHASGGAAMLQACAASQGESAVLGVTVLTSLDAGGLAEAGFAEPPLATAVRLAGLASDAGLRGVVASPLEIEAIRAACGPGLLIVTPGIRSSSDDAGDQRRTATPAEAVRRGADYIVVGRPVTRARDRRAAALAIVEEIAGA